MMGLCLVIGTTGLYLVSPLTFVYGLAYLLLNICYSLWLKHIAILDVTIISLGFVLRLFVGASATGILLSKWIIILTFLLALFLALAKRRDDVLIYLETGKKVRRVIDGYNINFVNVAMAVMAATVIVAYILYTVSAEVVARVGSEHLYISTLFVIMGIMKYLQLTIVLGRRSNPNAIVLQDLFMQLIILGWFLNLALMLYFH
jgi:4-hydroxybenzoate polyprenyltransferase